MLSSKKAQISDTMSWMVATIIIVLILSVPLFLIKFKFLENSFSIERYQDVFLTKSVSGYFLQNEKFLQTVLSSEEISDVEKKKLNAFFNSLSREGIAEIVHATISFQNFEGNEMKNKEIYFYLEAFWKKPEFPYYDVFSHIFVFEEKNGEKKIKTKINYYFSTPNKKYPTISLPLFWMGVKND